MYKKSTKDVQENDSLYLLHWCLALLEQPGTRVALDMTTLTIMRYLPREVDPLVYNMSHEDPGDVTYNKIGGLAEQIRELREVSACP